jgi:mono/diheme cytochrome c family protein
MNPMDRHSIFACLLVCLSSWVSLPSPVQAQEDVAETASIGAEKLWQSHIQPLLVEKCQKCHGGAKAEAGLDLRSIESVLKGSERGPVVIAGKPDESRLMHVIQPGAENVMPPESAGLKEDERILIQQWISKLALVENNPAEAWTTEAEKVTDSLTLPPADMPPHVVIDFLLARRWAEQGWTSNDRCDDATFLRRIYLDLAGRIPTPEEAVAFQSDTRSNKRAELVDSLLESADYADIFSGHFDTLLMGRPGRRGTRERSQNGWQDYLRASFAENRPWNETLREIALARPEAKDRKAATWFLFERKDNYQAIAESVSSAMFGVQIQCAQCHDHPLAPEIKQAHYWGLVAFFARGKNQMTPLGPRIAESGIGAYDQFTNIQGQSFPNLLTYLDVATIDDQRPEDPKSEMDDDGLYRPANAVDGDTNGLPRVPVFSRREAFVEQVLTDHPRVATAMVNRLWALMMGRGLVHPVDKMDSVHPSEHPELLAWLARDFREHQYDIKRILRAIALSSAYQLETGKSEETLPPASFAFALEKPLTAEVLGRSLAVGLYGSPGTERLEVQSALAQVFPDVLPEETITTLKQTLFLSNNPQFNACFVPQEGSLTAELMAIAEPERVVETLFTRLVNRPPGDDEFAVAVGYLQSRVERREEAIAQLAWALATSAEFRFNH